jgi:hypothetical protein
VTSTSILLLLSSCSTAITHALIPDHWLPFVLLSRAQRWSDRRTAVLTGLAGLLHVLMSIVLGGAAIAAGSGSAKDLAELAGRPVGYLAGLLLLFFGLAYGLWSYLRESRAHARAAVPGERPVHVHAHGHLLERWFRGALTGGALVVIIGMSPCALLAPILFAAWSEGTGAVLAAALGFTLCTIGTMIGTTLFAVHGMRRLDFPFLTRYGDLISGFMLAAIGVFLMCVET